MMVFSKVVGIGWDVGGWMGNNHGVAICEWSVEKRIIEWIGVPTAISLPFNGLLSLDIMLNAVSPSFQDDIGDNTLIIIGVDAPLGFSSGFVRLLSGDETEISKPEREIDNIFAYRHTDREIYRIFGKKPLSASFDRIGNNATVAMAHIRKWENENGFKTYPFQKAAHGDNKVILEVYPALVKERKNAEAFAGIKKFLPNTVFPGTDSYDAAICALYAIAFGANGHFLPILQGPSAEPSPDVEKEGWIYHFSKEGIEMLK